MSDHVARLQQAVEGFKLGDTDLANVSRFLRDHKTDVRFTPERGWLIWDGLRWQPDDLGGVVVKAKSTMLSIFDEIRGASEKDDIFKWAKRSQSARACTGPWRTRFRTHDGQLSDGMADTVPGRMADSLGVRPECCPP